MAEIIKNVELRGSTMGSFAEFTKAVEFIEQHKIVPVVDKVYDGLSQDNAEAMFERMKNGQQFGKLVIRIVPATQDAEDAKKGRL